MVAIRPNRRASRGASATETACTTDDGEEQPAQRDHRHVIPLGEVVRQEAGRDQATARRVHGEQPSQPPHHRPGRAKPRPGPGHRPSGRGGGEGGLSSRGQARGQDGAGDPDRDQDQEQPRVHAPGRPLRAQARAGSPPASRARPRPSRPRCTARTPLHVPASSAASMVCSSVVAGPLSTTSVDSVPVSATSSRTHNGAPAATTTPATAMPPKNSA